MTNKKDTSVSVDALLRYEVGQVVNARAAELDEGKTTPPPRYSEDSLIRDMENASKFAKNADDRALLNQTEGIGTARTRGTTLVALINRKLLTSKKNGRRFELISTDTARNIISKLPPWLKDVTTTAKWEMMLSAIERGEVDVKAVLESQKAQITQIVERAKKQIAS